MTTSKTQTHNLEITFPDRVAHFGRIDDWRIQDDLLIITKKNVTTVIPMRNVGRLVSETI